MQSIDQGSIHLQQRLATGQHHETVTLCVRPELGNRHGKRIAVTEAAASRAIHADEVGIAELAHGCRTIGFQAGP